MPLWDRFKRMVRSNVGRFLTDDGPVSRPGSPGMDKELVEIKANVTFLERKLEKLRRRQAETVARAKAAENQGATIASMRHETSLGEVELEIAKVTGELEVARDALTRAESVKQAFQEITSGRSRRPAPSAPEPTSPEPALDEEESPGRPRVRVRADGATDKTIGPPSKTIGGSSLPSTSRLPADPPAETEGAPAEPARKTLGMEDSGPLRVEPVEPPSGKTLGEADPGLETRADQRGGGNELVDELERLSRLLEAGAITPEEFQQAKARLLDR